MASAGQGEAVSVIERHGRGEERDSPTTTSLGNGLLGRIPFFCWFEQLAELALATVPTQAEATVANANTADRSRLRRCREGE